jgi:hypothetical protein
MTTERDPADDTHDVAASLLLTAATADPLAETWPL